MIPHSVLQNEREKNRSKYNLSRGLTTESTN